ncbi:hypothetical protein [Halopelagius longus]|nr:hypothetical protein [Halopelagius longus]
MASGVFLAGCSSSEPEAATSASRTPSEETDTPTPESVATDSPTPAGEETETKTETQSETPDDVERTLDRAANDLDKAVGRYVDAAGPNRGFHDLNATDGFSFEENAGPLYDARSRFNDIGSDATGAQRERLSRLREVYWFLWWAGKTHQHLSRAFYRQGETTDRFYGGEYDRVGSQVELVTEAAGAAKETVSNIKEQSRSDSLDAIDDLEPADYDTKVERLETEISQFDRFAEIVRTLSDEVGKLQRGFEQYRDEEYDDASGTFYGLSGDFEDLHETIVEIDAVEAVETPLDEFACITDALSHGCDVLDEAATAGGHGNPEKQEVAEDNAKAEFESCSVVTERMPMVQEFFDSLPEKRS